MIVVTNSFVLMHCNLPRVLHSNCFIKHFYFFLSFRPSFITRSYPPVDTFMKDILSLKFCTISPKFLKVDNLLDLNYCFNTKKKSKMWRDCELPDAPLFFCKFWEKSAIQYLFLLNIYAAIFFIISTIHFVHFAMIIFWIQSI